MVVQRGVRADLGLGGPPRLGALRWPSGRHRAGLAVVWLCAYYTPSQTPRTMKRDSQITLILTTRPFQCLSFTSHKTTLSNIDLPF